MKSRNIKIVLSEKVGRGKINLRCQFKSYGFETPTEQKSSRSIEQEGFPYIYIYKYLVLQNRKFFLCFIVGL